MGVRYDKSETQNRWPSILKALGVEDKVLSKQNTECPFCGGKDRFRFTDHEGAGVYVCNQCGTGNGIQFVQKYEGVDFLAAVEKVRAVLPMAAESVVAPERDPRRKLNKLWNGGERIEVGDPVWLYLHGRKLPVPETTELRYHSSVPYYKDGSVIAFHPAMLARVRDSAGNPKTLHVTYLTPDGMKADVEVARKILSKTGDGPSIRLNDVECGILHVTEGIETALGVQRHLDKHEAAGGLWALMSAGSMMQFQPGPEIERLFIWGDNDASFTGQHAAYTLAHRLRVHKRCDVEVLIPKKKDTDWAD